MFLQKTKKWLDDDDDDDSFKISEDAAAVVVAKRDKPSRARKPATYKLDSDSDSDF